MLLSISTNDYQKGEQVSLQNIRTKIWDSAKIIKKFGVPRSHLFKTKKYYILRRNTINTRNLNEKVRPNPQITKTDYLDYEYASTASNQRCSR